MKVNKVKVAIGLVALAAWFAAVTIWGYLMFLGG